LKTAVLNTTINFGLPASNILFNYAVYVDNSNAAASNENPSFGNQPDDEISGFNTGII